MDGMTAEQIASLIEHRKWVPIAGVVIWFLTRLLKSDTHRWLPSVPGRWRPLVPFAFGLASSVAEALILGKPWVSALVGGVVSAVQALAMQDVLINALRGGKEVPVPGLMVEGARPAPDKPVTVPPVADAQDRVETRAAPRFIMPDEPGTTPEPGDSDERRGR